MKPGIHKLLLSLALTSVLTVASMLGEASAETSLNTHYSSFDSHWLEDLQNQAEAVVSGSATPLVIWEPSKLAATDDTSLKAIVDGKQDAYLDDWLHDFKAWLSGYPEQYRPRIALEFAPTLYNDKHFTPAWFYLQQKFAAAGVDDSVIWVWNPDSGNYPGDDVVDWLSMETNLKAFDQAFNNKYARLVQQFPNKPILLVTAPEAHTSEDKKKGLINRLKSQIKEDYPAIKSVALFNTNQALGWVFNVADITDLASTDNAISEQRFSASSDLPETADAEDAKRSIDVQSPDTHRIDQTIKPVVVGSELLAREARGIKKMSKATLRKWRLEGILKNIGH